MCNSLACQITMNIHVRKFEPWQSTRQHRLGPLKWSFFLSFSLRSMWERCVCLCVCLCVCVCVMWVHRLVLNFLRSLQLKFHYSFCLLLFCRVVENQDGKLLCTGRIMYSVETSNTAKMWPKSTCWSAKLGQIVLSTHLTTCSLFLQSLLNLSHYSLINGLHFLMISN